MNSRCYLLLGLLAASLAGAWVTGRPLFFNLAYIWGAVLGVALVWAWLSLRTVRLARQTYALHAQVGQVFTERLTVFNTGRLPKLWLEIRDLSELPGHVASRVVTLLGGAQERVWSVNTLCPQRGLFRLGPLRLTGGDPLGLFQVARLIPQTSHIVVYPVTVTLPELIWPLGLAPGGEALRRRTQSVTSNAATVRDYAPGDAFNRIHWPSTARRDRLIVKEFELDPQAEVWLFLDGEAAAQAARPAPPPVTTVSQKWWITPEVNRPENFLPPSTEEYSVSVAASLAQYFMRHGRAVGLAAYGARRDVIQPDRGERQLIRLMETLAVFQAQGRWSVREVLTLEGLRLPRGVLVIVITASRDKRWLVLARALKLRGLQLAAVIVDAATFSPEGLLHSNAPLADSLAAMHIPACVVRQGEDLGRALTLAWSAR